MTGIGEIVNERCFPRRGQNEEQGTHGGDLSQWRAFSSHRLPLPNNGFAEDHSLRFHIFFVGK